MSDRCVVLLSGGLDSCTLLALAREAKREIYALSFDYGQRHAVELRCASRQAQHFGARAHEVVQLRDFGKMVAGATALVSASEIAVPKHATLPNEVESRSVPSTYVPARNSLFLAYGLAWAEALAASEIWIGANALDYSGYPDCRPDFLQAWQSMAHLATAAGREGRGVKLRAPLVQMRKAQIIERGFALGVDYAETVSCYDPVAGKGPEAPPFACKACESCHLRAAGFASAGIADPTRYVDA